MITNEGGRMLQGGRGASSVMRVNSHDCSFCGRSQGEFRLCGGEAVDGARLAAFRSPPPPLRAPTYKLILYQTLAGRGGSVSRRDHNQAAGNCAQLAWGHKSEGKVKPIPSYSSGGGPGEALLLEKRPPPAFSPLRLFGREREEGKDSHSRQWRLSMAVFLNRNKRPLAAPIEVAELLAEKPPPSHSSQSYAFSKKGEPSSVTRTSMSVK